MIFQNPDSTLNPSHSIEFALVRPLAAAPEPDPDAGPPRVVLGGAMPSATEEIRGCVFASRCPRKIGAICDTVVPPVRQFGKHIIVCHLDLPCGEDAHPLRRTKAEPAPGVSL